MVRVRMQNISPIIATSLLAEGAGGAPPPSPGQPPAGYGGPPGAAYGGAPPSQGTRSSGKAVTSLVLGIIGICIVWIPFIGWLAAITGILAVVFGALAKKEIDASQGQITGNGMAIAGLVLGIIQLILLILVAMIFTAMWADLMREIEQEAVIRFGL